MREFTAADLTADVPDTGVAEYLFDQARLRPDHVSLRRRGDDGTWLDVTARQFADEVSDVARGLLRTGIGHGDRVAVMSRTRWEWTLVDFALLSIGAVVVPVYETSSAEQVQWMLADSGTRAIFCESDQHRELVESVRSDVPDLEVVWVFEGGALRDLAAGEPEGGDNADQPDELSRRRATITGADLASIIYTSGTTGRPKGCELTHANFRHEVAAAIEVLPQLLNVEAATLLFLPIAHVFGRVIQIGAVACGCALGHSPDVRNLLDDLAAFRPTFVLAVPRVFEKVFNGAKQRADGEGHGRIFDRAVETAVAYSEGMDAGRIPLRVRLAHPVFDRLVYAKLRAALGGRCVAAVSGGAPLGARLGHFFRGLGVPVYEGYGLTETTAAISVNRPDRMRIGSVGQPVPGLQVRIADDGELQARGGVVFRRYWHNTQATDEALSDGWFHTGDLGELDADGYISIVGRKKEIIVTAGGKNVAPAVLEDRVRAHWLVSQCLVVGDGKPYIAALVTIDPDVWPTWLERHGKPADTPVADLMDDEALRAELQEAIDRANRAVSQAESIRRFRILPEDWTEAGGQVTPSLKLKRNVVLKQNAPQIDELYAAH